MTCNTFILCRPVYLQLLQKLNWKRLAALTEDGQKYTEYVAKLQDLLTSKNFTFVMNRKFPPDRDKDAMRSVSFHILYNIQGGTKRN